jgi:hypothetical protein
VLTASVLFPSITSAQILAFLGTGTGLALAAGIWMSVYRRRHPVPAVKTPLYGDRVSWRMPPLVLLSRPRLSPGRRLGLSVLRGYLIIASALVVVRVVQLALQR